MDYEPVQLKRHARPLTSTHNPESQYWRRFRKPIFVKEFGTPTSVHFQPDPSPSFSSSDADADAGQNRDGARVGTNANPSSNALGTSQAKSVAGGRKFAVTAGVRVQVYGQKTNRVVKTFARFKDVARSGHIRADGRLVVAGDDGGLIQVFDMNSRAVLRTLKGHQLPVHVTKFSPDNTKILSTGDDKTVRLWDMPAQTEVAVFEGHTDYVRTGVVSPDNPSLLLTGSYDQTVRLWDARTGDRTRAAMTMLHGAPVESVLVFPSGGSTVALSAGGPVLRVWDMISGGRCIRALSNHQKTITSLALDGSASRLLTGGLDQLVKVYDVADYRVVHTMRYPSPVLCLAVSPDDTHIVAGMSDGSLSIRRRELKSAEAERKRKASDILAGGAYEYFLRADGGAGLDMLGNDLATGANAAGKRAGKKTGRGQKTGTAAPEDYKVEATRRRKLKEYDRMLKQFQYGNALDAALRKGVPANTTFSLLLELVHRDGLRPALSSRDDVTLEPVLRFLVRHATNPKYAETVCDVAAMIIDLYAPVLGESPLIDDLFGRLGQKVEDEVRFQRELMQVRGALDMVFARSALG